MAWVVALASDAEVRQLVAAGYDVEAAEQFGLRGDDRLLETDIAPDMNAVAVFVDCNATDLLDLAGPGTRMSNTQIKSEQDAADYAAALQAVSGLGGSDFDMGKGDREDFLAQLAGGPGSMASSLLGGGLPGMPMEDPVSDRVSSEADLPEGKSPPGEQRVAIIPPIGPFKAMLPLSGQVVEYLATKLHSVPAEEQTEVEQYLQHILDTLPQLD